ncbi:regulator [Paenibacillus swuensis]|uniref:Regulator n=1 Tax=Paenibacillus swuensis TaxID=1178515 RepID=A0A172TKB0_9BACL|nr:YlbF family regulator [Paenibacillus swuensis]ANE47460.1 regulator [Paenibacillus swuensis]
MSIMEQQTLDMSALLMEAYNIGDLINASREVTEYLVSKQAIEASSGVQEAVKHFEKKKVLFEECERFGRFHPDFNRAMDEMKDAQDRLNQFAEVVRFKQAEKALDDLLHEVSTTIAYAVSESVKVPSNDPLPKGGGCSTGGGCSGKCS